MTDGNEDLEYERLREMYATFTTSRVVVFLLTLLAFLFLIGAHH